MHTRVYTCPSSERSINHLILHYKNIRSYIQYTTYTYIYIRTCIQIIQYSKNKNTTITNNIPPYTRTTLYTVILPIEVYIHTHHRIYIRTHHRVYNISVRPYIYKYALDIYITCIIDNSNPHPFPSFAY